MTLSPGSTTLQTAASMAAIPVPGKRDGKLVLGLKEIPKASHGLVHGQKKIRIQIAQNGADHGLENSGMDVAGPWTEQYSRIVRHVAS